MATSISRIFEVTNDRTKADIERVHSLMSEQFAQIVKLCSDISTLLSVEPEDIPGNRCSFYAEEITDKREELMNVINKLAHPPAVTGAWVETFNNSLYGIESYYLSRYRDWVQEQADERARQQRAKEYAEQCERERETHEARLRGDVV